MLIGGLDRAVPPETGDPLVLQVDHFADVVAGRAEPLVPGREGIASLAVIEAIKAAAEGQTRVTIGP